MNPQIVAAIPTFFCIVIDHSLVFNAFYLTLPGRFMHPFNTCIYYISFQIRSYGKISFMVLEYILQVTQILESENVFRLEIPCQYLYNILNYQASSIF